MTVEELIEELQALPKTAVVFVEALDDDDDELIFGAIDEVIYELGRVAIRYQS